MKTIVLVALASVLLLLCLFPPTVEREAPLPLARWQDVSVDAAGAAGSTPRAAVNGDQALLAAADTSALEVLAPGFPPDYWRDLADVAVRFPQEDAREGLVALHWTPRITLGETLRVEGAVVGNASEGAEAILTDPFGAGEARAALSDDGTFRLSVPMRSTGRYEATLEVLDAQGAVLTRGPLPVAVEAVQPLHIRIEASAPSFEVNALKTWASDGGAAVLVRTRLADEIYRTERIRWDDVEDAQSLSAVDVLVLDARAWLMASPQYRAAIADAVNEGLGLLVLAHGAAPGALVAMVNDSSMFPPIVAASSTEGDLRIAVAVDDSPELSEGAGAAAAAAVAAAVVQRGAVQLEAPLGALAQTLLSAADGEPIAAYMAWGQGRAAISTVTATHTLVTAGQGELHATLWRKLLRGVARTTPQRQLVQKVPAIRDERHPVCISGDPLGTVELTGPQGDVSSVDLATRESGASCGFWWPRQVGWHEARAAGMTWPVYVADPSDWQDLRAQEAAMATQRMAARTRGRDIRVMAPSPSVPPGWLALGFTLVAGALWLRERRAP